MKPIYLTTPIYYVNAAPHLGHAHTTAMGDILKRIYTMRGHRVLFSTGTDEHGQKNQQAIEASGLPAEEYLARQSAKFRSLFDALEAEYDIWVRTPFAHHVAAVEHALLKLKQEDLLVKKKYSGLYCVGCEQFKRPSDLDAEGNCVDHRVKPVEMDEENYFLVISRFQDWLRNEIAGRKGWIEPSFHTEELLALLENPLEDLCISRPRSRVWLGVPLPFDAEYVTYVWFDALLNYISNVGWPANFDASSWDGVVHLIGKDIMKVHCIYWPIILKALGVPPPAAYRVHGYWTGGGGIKMSKSLGNVVDPLETMSVVGADGLRFYLAKNMRDKDASISTGLVIEGYNADLCNEIGNLFSRVTKFVIKNRGGRIPQVTPAACLPELCAWVAKSAAGALHKADLHTISEYVAVCLAISNKLNAAFTELAPWKNANPVETDPALYGLLDCIRMLFELLYPVMPQSSVRALAALGCEPPRKDGGAHVFEPHKLVPGGALGAEEALFPRQKAAC